MNDCTTNKARTLRFGVVALMSLLSACAFTPQATTGEESIAGMPAGGAGGSQGGTGGGRATGEASGGASGGISTRPGAIPPTENGSPSMPADGARPNPAPSESSRSATGLSRADSGTAPRSAPASAGTRPIENEESRDTADNAGPDGSPNANETIAGADAAEQEGAERGMTSGEPGNADVTDAGNSEEPNSGDEPGQLDGEQGTGANVDVSTAAPPGAAGTFGSNQSGAGTDAAMTTAERRAAIRGRLEASIGALEQLTLEERERVQRAANANARIAGGTDSNGREAGDESDGTGGRSSGLAANSGGVGGATMPGSAAARAGAFDDEGLAITYPVPADIPRGDDDDTVARQIREAALREADPQLREKLWDEYRDYTGLRR